MIVQRGFPPPPSYHIDRLRKAPVGHFFDVMTNGYGAMYSYASRIAPEDRWRIAAYIRVLQLSENATIEDVPAADRPKLEEHSHEAGGGRRFEYSAQAHPVRDAGRGLPAFMGLLGWYARSPEQFFRSYLLAFVYWIGFPLGCTGDSDAESFDGRRLGIADPAAAGGRRRELFR